MESITKDDLRQLRMLLVNDIEKILDKKLTANPDVETRDWLRSKAVRSMMNISPGTLQNLRIAGKVRHKKVMGSYYYNRTDLQNLFDSGD